MTGIAIAVAAGAAALLILAVWAMTRRRRPVRIDAPEEAAAAAEQAIPGFVVAGAVVGADGRGALAVSADNRVVAMAPAGRRVVAREVGWRAVRATGDGILIDTGDRRIGEVALAGVDVLDIRRLTPVSGLDPAALAARGIAIGGLLDEIAAEEEAARVP